MADDVQTTIQEEGELLDKKQKEVADPTAAELPPISNQSVMDATTTEIAFGLFPATSPDFLSLPDLGDKVDGTELLSRTVNATAPDTMEDKSAV